MTNSRTHFRTLILATLAMLGLCAATTDAEAHGRVFVGGGVIVGSPYYAYPPYYGYPYYAYPPAPVYAAPPPYYGSPYPAPGYASAPPYNPPPPSQADRYYEEPSGEYCREYTHTVMVGGQPQHAYGHACREPDGRWRIVD